MAALLSFACAAPHSLGDERVAESRAVPMATILELSLEELARVKVISVSRKVESLADAAAAILVITNDEIRRSGVNVLAEALRSAAGLTVARPNSRQWAIGSRGFTDTFSNKLLVLMDGRTIYTPLFSGVFQRLPESSERECATSRTRILLGGRPHSLLGFAVPIR